MIVIINRYGQPSSEEQMARYKRITDCIALGIDTNAAIAANTGISRSQIGKDTLVLERAGIIQIAHGVGRAPSVYAIRSKTEKRDKSGISSAIVPQAPCHSTASVGECRVSLPRAPWEAAE